jgi:hypothetical protein
MSTTTEQIVLSVRYVDGPAGPPAPTTVVGPESVPAVGATVTLADGTHWVVAGHESRTIFPAAGTIEPKYEVTLLLSAR